MSHQCLLSHGLKIPRVPRAPQPEDQAHASSRGVRTLHSLGPGHGLLPLPPSPPTSSPSPATSRPRHPYCPLTLGLSLFPGQEEPSGDPTPWPRLPPHMEQGVLLVSHLADSGLKPQHNGWPSGKHPTLSGRWAHSRACAWHPQHLVMCASPLLLSLSESRALPFSSTSLHHRALGLACCPSPINCFVELTNE